MSFPRYESYKDSGVEWLGEVPEGWEVSSIRRIATSVSTGGTPKFETPSTEGIDGFLWYTPGDFGDTLVLGGSTRKVSSAVVASGETKLFPSGSVLIVSIGATLGKVGYIQQDASANQQINAVIPAKNIDGYFLAYSLSVKSEVMRYLSNASTIGIMNQEKTKDIWLVIPTFSEQHIITSFLDRETGKIDDLIQEQERLIAFLKEKRQAVISHAVTKGLNPDAPMKDSGIEWLGEVPTGWSIMPLKRDLAFLTSGSRGWAEHYSDEGALFIRIGNLTRDSICLDLSDIQRVTVPEGTEGERTKIQSGDILFSITAYLGSVAIVPDGIEPAFVSQHVALARLGKRHLCPEWVAYVALSSVGKTYLETKGYGGTKIQLSLDDVANLLITVPPLQEQIIIVAFLGTEIAKTDALVAEAQQAISLLKERRSALISAAVTGKIDVR